MRLIPLLSALLLVASCAPVGEKLELIKSKTAEGESFNQRLAMEYRDYAESLAERGHPMRANQFADKALYALDGESEALEEADGLENERAALLDILTDDVKDVTPDRAARTQALFDCWADEKGRLDSSEELCKESFTTAFADLQFIADTLVYGAGNRFAVHFPKGYARLSDNGERVIDVVAGRVRGETDYTIELIAYGKGKTLASRRIIAVEKALIKRGVNAGNMKNVSGDKGREVFLDKRESGDSKDAVGITIISLATEQKAGK